MKNLPQQPIHQRMYSVKSKAQVTFQTPWGTIKQEIFMRVITL